MERTEAVELLGTAGRAQSMARRARHGYWFPLVLFGAIILGALPFYYYSLGNYGGRPSIRIGVIDRLGLGGYPGNHPWGAGLYWLIAVPAGLACVFAWYAYRARKTGVAGRVWPFVASCAGLLAVFIFTAPGVVLLLHAPSWFDSWRPMQLFERGLTPILVISLGLFVLARLEHSRALLAIACAYLGVALLANLYNVENAFYRIDHWIVPGWAANISVAGGSLLFAGVVSFIGLRIGEARHGTSG